MNNVYRLYNKNGEHVLSILQCFDSDQNDVLDIANPDGKVLFVVLIFIVQLMKQSIL